MRNTMWMLVVGTTFCLITPNVVTANAAVMYAVRPTAHTVYTPVVRPVVRVIKRIVAKIEDKSAPVVATAPAPAPDS